MLRTRQFFIDYCKTFPGVYEDYPFHDANWTVMRTGGKKMFCAIYERNGFLQLNLKCEPMNADFLRSVYLAVNPAYHMNKVHWNTVTIDGTVPEAEILRMIADSFTLVHPMHKAKAKKKTKAIGK